MPRIALCQLPALCKVSQILRSKDPKLKRGCCILPLKSVNHFHPDFTLLSSWLTRVGNAPLSGGRRLVDRQVGYMCKCAQGWALNCCTPALLPGQALDYHQAAEDPFPPPLLHLSLVSKASTVLTSNSLDSFRTVFDLISLGSYCLCSPVSGVFHFLTFTRAVARSSNLYLCNRKLSINEKGFVNCGHRFKAPVCGWFFPSVFASCLSDL